MFQSAFVGTWVPAQRHNMKDVAARPGHEIELRNRPHSVIASAAKQSRLAPWKDSGLLRYARNDELVEPAAHLASVVVNARTHYPGQRCVGELRLLLRSNTD
ncbi:hypothetical protein ABIB73_000372 [Bradyrhizobium sp. F1.4.3]